MRGVIMGALALIVLQVVTANQRAAGAVGGVFGLAATASERFIDPNVPAIGPRPPASASAGAARISTTALAFKPGATTGAVTV